MIAVVVMAAAAVAAPGGLVEPPPARAGLPSAACSLLGTVGEGWWGKACNAVVDVGGKLASIGKKAGGVARKLAGSGLLQRAAGIAAIVAWVLGGAHWTIEHLGAAISASTSPDLTAHWFTGVYLRVEGLALFFTLLFVIAAAAEAIVRADLSVLARAVFTALPVAALATAVAVPLTMLLLAATDELSSGIAAIAGNGSTRFLTGAGAWVVAGLTVADPFFAVLAAGLVVAAGAALWMELLIREVAVYVVVGMLPIAFAALVWPARRTWAIRAVELLVALILAKVAIVAVLALGGAALAHAGLGSLSRLLAGIALIVLGAFTPWLLLRLIPMAEVAAAAVGHVRGQLHATAGLRTPEAAVAGQVAGRMRASTRRGTSTPRGGTGASAADGLAVGELLEQMRRRATTAEGAAGATVAGGSQARAGHGRGAAIEPEFSAPAQLRLPVDRPPSDQPSTAQPPGDGSNVPFVDAGQPPGSPASWAQPAVGGETAENGLPALPPDPGEPPLGGGTDRSKT